MTQAEHYFLATTLRSRKAFCQKFLRRTVEQQAGR